MIGIINFIFRIICTIFVILSIVVSWILLSKDSITSRHDKVIDKIWE